MRGLTRLERAILANKAIGVHVVPSPKGTTEYALLKALASCGRTKERLEPGDDGKPIERGYITDLGRLALRVCPPEES